MLLSFVISNQTPQKGTSISWRFSPAMATVSEFPPKSSAVQLRFNAKNMKMTQQCWDHSLQLYSLHQVAHLSWMTGRGIHLWWRNPSIWRSFEGYTIYIYIYCDFFLQISMNLCPSLPGIDLSLPGLEQQRLWKRSNLQKHRRQWKWKSQSPWEKKERITSWTPTSLRFNIVDGSEIQLTSWGW